MFEHLAVHSKIVVTGPQRSGTRIASQMIASDTGHEFVDEVDFLITDTTRFRQVLARDGVVVQAPHMLKDMVDDPPPGVFRGADAPGPVPDPRQRPTHWLVRAGGNRTELAKLGVLDGDSAALKYAYWDAHTKYVPYLELKYQWLRAHPMFVPAERRRYFAPLQTHP
jgi:hypothetical protein